MKNLNLTYLLFIGILILSSCSGDSDNNEDNTEPQTFLENYDGTIWEQPTSNSVGGPNYIFFQNSVNNPVIVYYDGVNLDCHEVSYLNEFYTIFENSENTLVLRADYNNGDFDVDTYSFSNGQMTYNMFEWYNNDSFSEDYILTLTSLTPSDFDLCD